MSRIQYITTDVFTQTRYEGNPLAIVRVPASISLTQQQRQLIAKEFNYSETVILHESEQSFRESKWNINIFLTTAEIPLAGHPIIGTACYLGTTLQATGAEGNVKGVMVTKAGDVPFVYDTKTKVAELEIPHAFQLHERRLDSDQLAEHRVPQDVCEDQVGEAVFASIVKGMTFCLVELSSLEALGKLKPDLKEIESDGLTDEYINKGFVGFMFYVKQEASADGVQHVRTRMIIKTLEDSATGSASSALAVYLGLYANHSGDETPPEQTFELTQGVEMGRKSIIGLKVVGDRKSRKIDRVVLRGSAVQVMEGSLVIPP